MNTLRLFFYIVRVFPARPPVFAASLIILLLFLRPGIAAGAAIMMDGSDALNSSSFNSGLNWTGGAVPASGNAYLTSSFLLRTPPNNASVAFAGNSLEVQAAGEFRLKTSAIVTVTNLVFDNGSFYTLTAPTGGNVATLAGNGVTLNGIVMLRSGIQASENVDVLTNASPLGGPGGFTTTGSFGTIIFTGTNSFSGGATVNGGTVLVNASFTGSPITITSGTLGGKGFIKGAVTNQAGGILQPGLGGADTSALIISNALNLAGTSWFVLNRGVVPNASQITGITTATLGGTLIVSNAGSTLQLGDAFRLLSASAYTGSFSALNLPALGTGLQWSNNLAVNGTIIVVTNNIIAPGTWTNDASGFWSTAANWAGGNIANGSGSAADFSTVNITADRTVTLDSSRTISNLLFGDPVGTNNWFLNSSGGSVLTLAISAGTPTITVNNDSATVNLSLAGTAGLTKAGAGILNLAGNNSLTGQVTVNAGALNIAGSVASTANTVVGNSAGNAVLGLSGTISPFYLLVGNVSNAVGAVYQSGGTVNAGTFSGYDNLSLGNVPGSFGYYTVNGGLLTVDGVAAAGEVNNGATSSFGPAGNGIFEVNGGTVNDTGWFLLGRNNSAPGQEIGILNVYSGSLSYAGGGIVGPWDTGESAIINILGGTVYNTANVGVYLGNVGCPGILNLNGGLLEASIITGYNGPSYSAVTYGQLNFNGGTLEASAATLSFIQVSTANIYGGGATINNNGLAVTIAQPLLAPSGNGISSLAAFTGGAGYIAPPIITITNAPGDTTGTGATAIAQINPLTGVVTNVIITCPGVNYTATPVFVVSGGGATNAATITGGPLSPDSSGGLTVAGGGALTLSAANTYLGPTLITNSSLNLAGSVAGGVVVANGGTLMGNGSIGGALTNQSGGLLMPGLGSGDTSSLTVGGSVVLAGANYFTLNRVSAPNASSLDAGGTVTFGGTLTVTNAGLALQPADSFTLFNAAAYTGNFSAVNLPALASGLAWTNTLALNGAIAIISSLPPTNAVVTNQPATQIFATSAALNGQVLSTGGQAPSITIYYGPDDGYTNAAGWSNSLALGVKNSLYQAVASGLATNTTYYFTASASNGAGVAWAFPAQSFSTLAANPFAVHVPMLTYHNDNSRQGQNTNETLLTLANVNTNTFGRLFSYPVDAYVYSQPLIMTNVTIPGQGVHDVVFIATENDTVYAFDADSNSGTNGGVLWQTNLGVAALNSLSPFGRRYTGANNPYTDITPQVGATGTPVIDPVTGTLYVNAFTREQSGNTTNYVHRIHALDITTGNERPYSPVVIAGSVPGTGVDSAGGVMTFNPMQNNQRPALTLAGGRLYVAYAGYADTDPYHGWLFGLNATNLALQTNYIFNTTPNATTASFGGNAAEGGIWQGGGGLVADTNNNLFFETGNGSFSANTNGGDYADSFMRISTTNGLAVADYFTPYDQASLSANDTDLGSCGPLLLPDSVGNSTHPHLLAGLGKSGKMYLIDRDTMGAPHYQAFNDSQIVQSFVATPTGIWSPPTYFNNLLYVQPSSGPMKSFSITNATVNPTAIATSPVAFGQFNGGPVVSANGASNGIVWVLNSAAFASSGPAVLYAFNATNILQMLYNSSQLATRDNPGGAVKMTTPTVAGGKVYVPAQYSLSVYGVQLFLDAPAISPAGGAFTNSVTITLSDASVGTAIYYTLDGTAPTAASLPYATPFTLHSNALVRAVAVQAGAVNSAVAAAAFVNTAAAGNGAGLLGQYFAGATSANPFAGPPVLVQTNATINFLLGTNWPGATVGSNDFTVRWTGSVQPQFTENYSFVSTADDGVRLFINGQQLINDWTDKTAATSVTNTIPLVAQQFYTVELDYYQKTNNAAVSLAWSSPSTPYGIVPQTQLYPFTNPPPTVVLTAPDDGASYTASASVTLAADADAPNNTLSAVAFYANDVYLGSVADVPYSLTTTGLAAGSYALTAVATDASGVTSTSAVVHITVNPGGNQPYGLTSNSAVSPFLHMPTTFAGSLPAQLSLTGIFSNTPAMTVTNGLFPYTPNTPLWSDGALKIRYLSVPATGGVITPDSQIGFNATAPWTFPAGTLFVKTFLLNTDTRDPNVLHRLETRVLVRDINGAVYGVTYKWRPDNSDADLLSSSLTENIIITNATGTTTQAWYYPSPSDCLTCHTPVSGYVLGLNTRQLNGPQTYPATGVTDNQLRTLNRLGLFNPAFDEAGITNYQQLSALTNLSASLEQRARSYLDANCMQCHQPGGSGITFDARYTTPLANQNITNYPASFSLGVDHACIVKSQDVWRSVLYQRINSTNNAIKMPSLARNLVDTNAVAVIGAWINSLPGTAAEAPPVIAPDGGNYFGSVGVTLSAPDPDAAVYYTLDGTLPTTNSALYSSPFNLTGNATVTASAWRDSYNNSVGTSALFLVTPLSFTSAGFLPNRQLQLNFLAATGSNYVLQATTNFSQWVPVGTNTAATNAVIMLDPGATNYPYRFYRVLQQ